MKEYCIIYEKSSDDGVITSQVQYTELDTGLPAWIHNLNNHGRFTTVISLSIRHNDQWITYELPPNLLSFEAVESKVAEILEIHKAFYEGLT
jgi:hypothetical protein